MDLFRTLRRDLGSKYEPLEPANSGRHVKNLYVLVHPFYTSNYEDETDFLDEIEAGMPESWLRVAQDMDDDDVLVVLAPNDKGDYREALRDPLAYEWPDLRFYKELGETLGRNLIFITSSVTPEESKPHEDRAVLKRVLKGRGLQINEKTRARFFGEFYDECVQNWMEDFTEGLGLIDSSAVEELSVRYKGNDTRSAVNLILDYIRRRQIFDTS